ncbi:MAG TPA: outer membrane protein assembly factor BamD [Tepidisphaeraceae bacterium]|nr:outer membrane protein assembly factor BamD [Tepidisphaeraceae bacterium]
MIRGSICVILAFAVLAVSGGLPFARGESVPAPAATSQPAPARELDLAETDLQKHNWTAAHDLIVGWLQAHPTASNRDRAVYLLAELYYHSADRIRAFYHCDELMDNYPESKLYFPALELQYKIADAYLNGYKETFLGMRILPQTEEAIEMLYRIQERSPGSPIAERALKRTADYYFNNSDFDLAGDAYGAFIRSYPRSPEIPQVRLRQAFSSLAQFRGPRFDATPLIDARAQFRDVQARYPDLAADANVAGWIDRIDADLAHKAYVKADFYRRTEQPHGAVYLYRYVIQTYPNTSDAGEARRFLKTMPAFALADAPPPASNPESAATQPAVPGVGERAR